MTHTYTLYDTPEIVATIEADLAFILSEIRAVVPDMVALILAGGFGRGEGSVIAQDGRVVPVNDYDVHVITHSRNPGVDWAGLEQRLAAHIGVRWVDIEYTPRRKLRRLRGQQYGFDLKYGGRVLWGEPNILEEIPPFTAREIRPREVEKLFFTRLWCFLGPVVLDARTDAFSFPDCFFATAQLSKAVVACVEALLIARGVYCVRCAEKMARLQAHAPEKSALLSLAEWAIAFKLDPGTPAPEADDLAALYDRARDVYLDVFGELLGGLYGRRWQGWASLTRLYHPPLGRRAQLRRMVHFVRHGRFPVDVEREKQMARLFLVYSWNQSVEYNRRAKEHLVRAALFDAASPPDWEALRKVAVS
ncbi:MAG: hypothetical protein ACE5OS_00470 [Anaerolineae bacterium]